MTKNKPWKRVVAGLLALALVTGGMPVNVESFLTRSRGIVASASSESDLSNATVTMAENSAEVTSVVLNGITLTADTDYTVSYRQVENELETAPTEAGTYTAVITGTGDYSGTVEHEFTIVEDSATLKWLKETCTQDYNMFMVSQNAATEAQATAGAQSETIGVALRGFTASGETGDNFLVPADTTVANYQTALTQVAQAGVVYITTEEEYVNEFAPTVSFNVGDVGYEGEENLSDVKSFEIPLELPTLTADGYIFGGWYTDETFETLAVAGTPIDGDTTLYAKWIALTHYERTDATCTATGNIEYYLDSDKNYYSDAQGTPLTDLNHDGVVNANDVFIPPTGHTYGKPVWTWDKDYTTASAVFTCNSEDDTQTIVAEVTSQTTDPTYTADGQTVYTAKVIFNGAEYTDTKTVPIPKLTLNGKTFSEDTTFSGNLQIDTGETCTVDGCVVVFDSLTLKKGAEGQATTLNLTNNAVVVINGNFTLNDYSSITAENGCKVIVTGTFSQSETGTEVDDSVVLTKDFYPENVSGVISYTPATDTENGYFTIGTNETHYAFKDNAFTEFTEYNLTAENGIIVKDSRNKTVTGKLSSVETYTLTSENEFFVTIDTTITLATKDDTVNEYTLTLDSVTADVTAEVIKTLTGDGSASNPIVINDESELRSFAVKDYNNSKVYVKIAKDITLTKDVTLSSNTVLTGSGSISGRKIIMNGEKAFLTVADNYTGTVDEILVSAGTSGFSIEGGTVTKLTNNYRMCDGYVNAVVKGGTVTELIDNGTVIVSGGVVTTLTANGQAGGAEKGEYQVYYTITRVTGGTVETIVCNEGSCVEIDGSAVVNALKKNYTYTPETAIAPSAIRIYDGTFKFDPTGYLEPYALTYKKVEHDAAAGTYRLIERTLTGEGTQANPYIISDKYDLELFASSTSEYSGYFKIGNDSGNKITMMHEGNSWLESISFYKSAVFVGGTIEAEAVSLWGENKTFVIDGGRIEGKISPVSDNFSLESGYVKELENHSERRVEINGGEVGEISSNYHTIYINGGTVGNIENFVNQFYAGKVIIDGGTINGTLTDGTFRITGGSFKNDPTNYLLEGEKATLTDNNYYVVQHNSSYRTFSETTNAWTTEHVAYGNYTKVESSDTVWTNGTYVVTKDTVLNQRVTVNGDVKLILEDGVTLTAKKGIAVLADNTFSVYGQANGTGTLYAGTTNGSDRTADNDYAGIGGNAGNVSHGDCSCGTLKFYGGNVYARAEYSAAIGGQELNTIHTIIFYGGRVEAWSGSYGEAIGNGWSGTPSTVMVYGGTVISHSSDHNVQATWYWNPDVTARNEGNTVITGNTGSGVIIEAGNAHVIDLKDCTIAPIPVQNYANGAQVKPKLTVTYKGHTLVEGVHYTVSYSDNTNLGTATATINGKGVVIGTNSATFKIEKAQAKYTTEPTAKTGLVYNGDPQALVTAGVTDDGTILYGLSDSATVEPETWSTDVPTETNAGTYYVWATIEPDTGHRANEVKCVSENGITIGEATINVTISPKNNIVYDGKELDISDFNITGANASLVSNQGTTVTVEAANAGDDIKSAGSHSVKITIERENYQKLTRTVSVNIAQRPIIITPTAGLKSTYGKDVLSGDALTYTVSNIVDGDEVNYTVNLSVDIPESGTAPDVGEYGYKLASTETGNSNYVLAIADGAKYTIEQRKDVFTLTEKAPSVVVNSAKKGIYVGVGFSANVKTDELEIVEYGLLYNNNGNVTDATKLTLDAVDGKNIVQKSGKLSLNIRDYGKGVVAVGYVTLKDASGQVKTYYTNNLGGKSIVFNEKESSVVVNPANKGIYVGVGFSANIDVAEYTIADYGLLYNNNGNVTDATKLTLDAVDGKNIVQKSGKLSLNIRDYGKGVVAVGYVRLQNTSSQEAIVYTNDLGGKSIVFTEKAPTGVINPANSKPYVGVGFSANIDTDGYEIEDYGILYNNDGTVTSASELTLGAVDGTKVVKKEKKLALNLRDTGKGVVAVGYVQLKNKSDQIAIVYTDNLGGKYSELVN